MNQFDENILFNKHNLNKSADLAYFSFQNYDKFDMRAHHHKEIEIMYVYSGKASVFYTQDNVKYEEVVLNGNQYILIDSNVKHKLVVDSQGVTIYSVLITVRNSKDDYFTFRQLYDVDPKFRYFIEHGQLVYKAFDNNLILETIKLIQKYTLDVRKSNMSKIKLQSMLSTLFISLAGSYNDQFKDVRANRINLATNYIQNHLRENISVVEIAKLCSISCNYLNTLFKDLFNCCVNDYINKSRITKACEIIAKNEVPLSKIMNEVGYSNKMTFNRNFVKFTGTRPSSFKKIVKQNSYATNLTGSISVID